MRFPSPRPGSSRAAERTAGRVLAAFLLLASLATAPAAAGWWDDAADARESTLQQLREAPQRWRDVPVLITARFGGAGERVNPFFTQFTPERWQPVRLLPPAGSPGADRELATAFVARGGRDDLRLATIAPNRPVLVRAIVRDEVAGEPWVEILSFTLDGDPLTPEETTRIATADRFLERRNPAAAEALYRKILAARRLDDHDRAGLLRRLGVALHDQRRPQDALATFREALELDPDDLDARHRATHLEESLARTPLPRTDGATPPTAGRAAAATPQAPGETSAPPDTPLLLPGRGPRLAPPSGLPLPPVPTADDATRGADPQQAGSVPVRPTPAKGPAKGSADAERTDDVRPPGTDDATEDDAEDDTPLPPPPRSRLSGPQ